MVFKKNKFKTITPKVYHFKKYCPAMGKCNKNRNCI